MPQAPQRPRHGQPGWAVALIQLFGTLSLGLIGLYALQKECRFLEVGLLCFGLTWILLGLFILQFDWTLPRERGSGFYSRRHTPKTWYSFCIGMLGLGGICFFKGLDGLLGIAQLCH